MNIQPKRQVTESQPAKTTDLSPPTRVEVGKSPFGSGASVTVSGKWVGQGTPSALVFRREDSAEKSASFLQTGFAHANDELSVTFHVDGLSPGKYVAALVFGGPGGPLARFTFDYGPKMQSVG